MTITTQSWPGVLRTTARFLTFRSTREELLSFGGKHLAFGLFCTWLVGIGRYWDNPRVSLLRHLGVGSIVYIFVLALLLYLIVLPLKPKDWSYSRVLIFVSLVSPPAALYAIPVERFFDLDTANTINVSFLGIVAAWRVALLVFYLRRFAALDWVRVVTLALLPLTLVVITLTILNVDRVVFDFMGGISPSNRSGNDLSYGILFVLAFFSFLMFVPALTCYIILALSEYFFRRKEELKQLSITDDGKT
jgi:hypothetical protein